MRIRAPSEILPGFQVLQNPLKLIGRTVLIGRTGPLKLIGRTVFELELMTLDVLYLNLTHDVMSSSSNTVRPINLRGPTCRQRKRYRSKR